MPSIQEAVNQDLSSYTAAEKSSPQASLPPAQGLEPTLNSMIRCPLPPIFQAAPDSLRQFYQGGQVPQTRFLSPVNASNSQVSTTTSETAFIDTGGGSGGGSSTTIKALQVSVTTGSLAPGQNFIGSALTSRSFQLLSIAAGSPVRVRLYATALAQSADVSRGLDVPPPAGTMQNIICDVVLDTAPFQWSFQSRMGANADNPQTGVVYVTMTNIDSTSDLITMTLSYVPLES